MQTVTRVSKSQMMIWIFDIYSNWWIIASCVFYTLAYVMSHFDKHIIFSIKIKEEHIYQPHSTSQKKQLRRLIYIYSETFQAIKASQNSIAIVMFSVSEYWMHTITFKFMQYFHSNQWFFRFWKIFCYC